MDFIEHGLYNIKDSYFENFPSKYFSDNKKEKRPHYYAFKDSDGILWCIPLSSQTSAYELKIKQYLENHKICIFYHIGKINGVDRVFLIGNMFPVTEEYIKKPFTISKVHYVVKNKLLIKEIQKRAKKYITLVKYKKLKPNVNIMQIKEILMNNKLNGGDAK